MGSAVGEVGVLGDTAEMTPRSEEGDWVWEGRRERAIKLQSNQTGPSQKSVKGGGTRSNLASSQ